MEVTASAPGKLFLVGEYGVTRGGPAIGTAVSRRLSCRARRRRGSGILALRSGARSCRLRLAHSEPADAPEELRFMAAAGLLAARVSGLRDLDVDIESESALDAGDGKTGLGGSAAVTAATVAAVAALAGEPDDAHAAARRLRVGIYAHRLAQGGGSAADVVVATLGGLVRAEGLDARDVPTSIADAASRVARADAIACERLALPPGLGLEVAATGRPARSGPRAARFAARVGEGGVRDPVLAAWLDGMRWATDELTAGCRACDATRARIGFAVAGRLLERLAPLVAIPVLTAELRRACHAARACGAVAKPSGAGGGDCVVALVAEAGRRSLREAWSRAGLTPLELAPSPDGVRVAREPGRCAGG